MVTPQQSQPRQELITFEAALPRILEQHEGEYVVIQGTSLVQYFKRYDEALEWAYSKFGLDSFFVKKVMPAELAMVHFTRDLGPCRN